MSSSDYTKALRLGKRDFEERTLAGERPTLPVLDDVLPPRSKCREYPLGVQNIPLSRVIGTRHAERSYSFSSDFMPLLDEGSEFAMKWASVADYHRDTGIADPVKAYEFLHYYYIEEGNKRVSVMKFFDAVSIPANVIRLIPPKSPHPEVEAYYEFLDFYDITGMADILYSVPGRYPALLKCLCGSRTEVWDEDQQKDLRSFWVRFQELYVQTGGRPERVSTDDAFLEFVAIQHYDDIKNLPQSKLRELVSRSQSEFALLGSEHPVDLVTEVPEKPQQSIFSRFFSPGGMGHVKIAFIYEKTIRSSSWTYSHELGRLSLMHTYPGEIETEYYEQVTRENIAPVLEDAIARGHKIIFTTTPVFAPASVKAAIAHPEVEIINCSVNTSFQNIRSYYPRLHEAKFVLGALAAAVSSNDRLFYLGDYPIYGSIASINAFALGAQLVNPHAEVYLAWSSQKGADIDGLIRDVSPGCVLGKDMIVPDEEARYFGLYALEGERSRRLAMPVCYWGALYQKLVEAISDGTWAATEQRSAINYWWGMSADVVGVFYANNLPLGTIRLIRLLMDTIKSGEFVPFSGRIFSQDGIVCSDPRGRLTPEEIIHMDWLAENVVGNIPKLDDLVREATPVMLQQGVIPQAESGSHFQFASIPGVDLAADAEAAIREGLTP